MPRVTEEYLEQRRQQILDAARRCFARQGFYQTSMQDVFAESGLSAGAVYRYFKSKDELVRAIAASTLGQISAIITDSLAEDPAPGLDEMAGRLAAGMEKLSGADGPARIAPAGWAAALHDPAVAEIMNDVLGAMRERWVQAARRMADDGRLPADADVDAVGSAMFSLFPGFLVQYLILGGTDAATLQRGLHALLKTEVTSPGRARPDRNS